MLPKATDWAQWAFSLLKGTHKPASRPRLHIETLEDRVALSTAPTTGAVPVMCACPMCAGAPLTAQSADFQFINGSTSTAGAAKWPQPGGVGSTVTITYSYAGILGGGLGGGLEVSVIRASIEEALGRWASVAPLRFVEVNDGGPALTPGMGDYSASGRPMLRFGTVAIDGQYNTLAYAYYPGSTGLAGDLFFDSGENWSNTPTRGIDLIEVAVHEIGHTLGLGHEPMPSSGGNQGIMNPYYGRRFRGPGTSFLHSDDINGIRTLYGTGVGAVVPLSGTTSANPASPAPPAVNVTGPSFSDGFTRASSIYLGAEWADRFGDFQVVNNRAVASINGPSLATLNGYSARDVSVQANVNITAGPEAYAGLVARYTGTGDQNYYYADVTGSGGTIQARIFLNYQGQLTLLASARLTSGTGTLRFEVVGGSQRLFFNSGGGEQLVTSSNDTLLEGAGAVGLRAFGRPGAVSYDDFATQKLATTTASLPYGPDGFAATAGNRLGTQWSQRSGDFGVDGVLSNNTVQGLAVLNGVAERDVSVQASVNVTAGREAYTGLVARYTGPGDANYYYADVTGSGGTIQARIFLNHNGVFTLLDSATLTGGVGTMRFEVVGGSQRLFFNDGSGERLVASSRDTLLEGAGTVGVRAFGAPGSVTYDNFAAQRVTAAFIMPAQSAFSMSAPEQAAGQSASETANATVATDVSVALAAQGVQSLATVHLSASQAASKAPEADVFMPGPSGGGGGQLSFSTYGSAHSAQIGGRDLEVLDELFASVETDYDDSAVN